MYKYVFIWDTGDGEGELSGTLERTIPTGVPRRVLLMKRQIFLCSHLQEEICHGHFVFVGSSENAELFVMAFG